MRRVLAYPSDLPYEILTDRVQPWSYEEFEGRHVAVASLLAEAMRHNPHLRVYAACGYYDGARTKPAQTERRPRGVRHGARGVAVARSTREERRCQVV